MIAAFGAVVCVPGPRWLGFVRVVSCWPLSFLSWPTFFIGGGWVAKGERLCVRAYLGQVNDCVWAKEQRDA